MSKDGIISKSMLSMHSKRLGGYRTGDDAMLECPKCKEKKKMRFAASDDMWICSGCDCWWYSDEVK